MLRTVYALLLAALPLGHRSPAEGPPQLPAGFRQKLAAAKMQFRSPSGLVPVPVVANRQMSYDYALRAPGKHPEIRFAILPLGGLVAEYQRNKGKKNADLMDPNTLYPVLLQTVLANVSAGDEPATEDFPSAAVRREFNADWGSTAVLRPGAAFGPKYAHCMVVALHKKGAADAYCFYLFDKGEDIEALMTTPTPDAAAFHALRFLYVHRVAPHC